MMRIANPIKDFLDKIKTDEDTMFAFRHCYIQALLHYRSEIISNDYEISLDEESSPLSIFEEDEFSQIISPESNSFDRFLETLEENLDE